MLIEEFDADFRRDAIEASVLQLRQSGKVDPLDCQQSFCLPTEHGRRQLRSQGWLLAFSIVMAVFGFGSAGLLVMWESGKPEESQSPWLLAMAFVLGTAGIGSLFLPVLCGGMLVRKHLGERFDALQRNANLSKVMSVGLEDAATFSQMKVISEDCGYLGIDPVGRRLIIEGVVCRYVIRVEDIDQIQSKLVGSSPGTEIHYRVGEGTVLGITIEKMSLLAETVRQLTGRARNPAYEAICQGLGISHDATVVNATLVD